MRIHNVLLLVYTVLLDPAHTFVLRSYYVHCRSARPIYEVYIYLVACDIRYRSLFITRTEARNSLV